MYRYIYIYTYILVIDYNNYVCTYRVAKKTVPNFAQVFSRSLSRYEGDILQVY